MPSLSFVRVLRESAPVALILAVWGIVAVATGLGLTVWVAGLLTAALYALVRGRALASDARPVFGTNDPGSVGRTTVRMLLPALSWFALAAVSPVVGSAPFVGEFVEPITDVLVLVFQGTGLVTVLLYAVAAGTASLRGEGAAPRAVDD